MRTSATVAKEVSIDTGSAPNGGDLGCVARGVTVKEFEDALFATPVGTVSKPVQTQFGYHVIKVTDKKAPAFNDAKPQVLQKLFSDSNDKFNELLNGSLTKAKVSVDPRFGTWNTVAERGRAGRLREPPELDGHDRATGRRRRRRHAHHGRVAPWVAAGSSSSGSARPGPSW